MAFPGTITASWIALDLGFALALFAAYIVVDALYAEYTLRVMQYKEYSAATIGAVIHLILAFGVLQYVQNFLYVIPIAAGSWVGTFIVIRRERLRHAAHTSSRDGENVRKIKGG